jgi:hypothetical protein
MTTRRNFLQKTAAGAAGVPIANLLALEAWAAEAKITEDDPMAVALGYVHDATTADRGDNTTADCTNCFQYAATADDWGTCNIFPGKLVAGPGWCKVWVAKQ